MLLLIGVWIFFMRQMQGGGGKGAMSFGKSKARMLTEDQIKTTLPTSPVVTKRKKKSVNWLNTCASRAVSELGGKIPKGVLMVGLRVPVKPAGKSHRG